MMQLDKKDQGLINLLRADARTSIVDLAKQMGLSRVTIQNRLRRLEEREIIRGYTILIGPETQRPEIRALMNLETDSSRESAVIAQIRGNPQIRAVHHTTGKWDLIAEIETDSLSSFNKIIGKLRLIDGVIATETNLILESYE